MKDPNRCPECGCGRGEKHAPLCSIGGDAFDIQAWSKSFEPRQRKKVAPRTAEQLAATRQKKAYNKEARRQNASFLGLFGGK